MYFYTLVKISHIVTGRYSIQKLCSNARSYGVRHKHWPGTFSDGVRLRGDESDFAKDISRVASITSVIILLGAIEKCDNVIPKLRRMHGKCALYSPGQSDVK